MSKIRVANWLLTRRCNLNCSYCGIIKNYKEMPKEYPKISHYLKNEMSTEYVLEGLKNFKKHNPECFHIFYGGEPLLRADLADIINYCNKEDIYYTIITNNSPAVQPLIKDLLEKTDFISGFTSSVDPIIFNPSAEGDIVLKSIAGLKRLTQYKDIKDRVAEITIDRTNVKYIYQLVKKLTDEGISSSITFIDDAKTPYYDFSNVADKNILVEANDELMDQFKRIFKEKLDIHMGEPLFKKTWEILPSNLICDLDKNLHNVTIDADGGVRLCLRIRGIKAPSIKLDKMFNNGEINPMLKSCIAEDHKKYCKGCNWTCVLMTQLVDEEETNQSELLHTDKRRD